MYCPFCGWELKAYRITHGVHKTAYQCENGACEQSPRFLVIEVLGILPTSHVFGPYTVHTRKE